MKSPWIRVGSLAIAVFLGRGSDRVLAQIVPDNTLPVNSTTTPGCTVCTIDGGTIRGGNLFHSFREFSILNPAGVAEFSNRGLAIQNILTRVTGGLPSTINGLIKTEGTTNFFFLNPSGITFGATARLQIGGSFFASTASSFVFPDGEFSATNPQAPSLLTVNLTPGLQYGPGPAAQISNAGNLEARQDLTLAAGNLNLGGILSAGRNLTLQALNTVNIQGTVGSDRTINVYSGGEITVSGLVDGAYAFGNGSDVTLDAKGNITLLPGSQINSTGILGGTITVNSDGILSIKDGGILNFSVGPASGQKGGDIKITARSLRLDNATISTSTIPLSLALKWLGASPEVFNSAAQTAEADAGNIVIQVGDVSLLNNSQIRGAIEPGGIGKGSEINIQADGSLSVTGGSQIGSFLARGQQDSGGNVTVPGGQGTGGTTRIHASDVLLSGTNSDGFSSGLIALTERDANGAAGNVEITTGTLRVEKAATITAGTRNSGAGGNIKITVGVLEVLAGGKIQVNSDDFGAGGTIDVTADRITIAGKDENFVDRFNSIQAYLRTPLASQLGETTDDVLAGTRSANSGLFADTRGFGTAGKINLSARQIDLSASGLITTSTGGDANGGDIQIRVQNLSLTSGAEVFATTNGAGTGGQIVINRRDGHTPSSVLVSGIAPFTHLTPTQIAQDPSTGQDILIPMPDGGYSSGLIVNSDDDATGRGGNVIVNIDTLRLEDGGVLSARTRGAGAGGNVVVDVNNLDLLNGGQILTVTYGAGAAGNILVNATNQVTISGVDAEFNQRFEQIRQKFLNDPRYSPVLTPDQAFQLTRFTVDPFNGASGLQAAVDTEATGDAGFIGIVTPSLQMNRRGDINSSVLGNRKDGTLIQAGNTVIQTNGGTVSLDNASIFNTVEPGGVGNGGSIFIETGSLLMSNGASLQTLLRGPDARRPDGAIGNAGVVSVRATDTISLTGVDPSAFTSEKGQTGIYTRISDGANGSTADNGFAGNVFNQFLGIPGSPLGSIFLQTGNLSLANGAVLDSSTFGNGNAGAVVVRASGTVSLVNGSSIQSVAGSSASKNSIAGGIIMRARDVFLGNGSELTTNVENVQDPGGAINAGLLYVAADRSIILNRQSNITATTRSGLGGDIILRPAQLLLLRYGSQISTTAGTAEASGDGGNIFVNSLNGFLLTAPRENNDITANAFSGSGGQVIFNAQTTYWFTPRSRADLVRLLGGPPLDTQRLQTNDITAVSQENPNLNGLVSINNLGFDPSRGFIPTPPALADNSRIAQRCNPRSSTAQEVGTFYITGRGGLPQRPGDLPLSDYPTGTVQTIPGSTALTPATDRSESTVQAAPNKSSIVEADRLTTDPNGNLWLVAQAPSANGGQPWSPTPECRPHPKL